MPEEKKAKLASPFNFTSLLTFFFLSVAAMTAAYIWGVISGRHYMQKPAPVAQVEAPRPEQEQSKEQERILKAQELEFVNVLRGEKPVRPHGASKPESGQVESAKTDAAPAQQQAVVTPQQQPGAITEPAATTEVSSEAEKPVVPQEIKPELESPGAYFDYVFQMAAFKDEQAADNLRERLEGRGLRTRLERKGKAFIVLAVLRGTAERASELIEIAKELRLGDPLLRSKRQASSR